MTIMTAGIAAAAMAETGIYAVTKADAWCWSSSRVITMGNPDLVTVTDEPEGRHASDGARWTVRYERDLVASFRTQDEAAAHVIDTGRSIASLGERIKSFHEIRRTARPASSRAAFELRDWAMTVVSRHATKEDGEAFVAMLVSCAVNWRRELTFRAVEF